MESLTLPVEYMLKNFEEDGINRFDGLKMDNTVSWERYGRLYRQFYNVTVTRGFTNGHLFNDTHLYNWFSSETLRLTIIQVQGFSMS